VTLTLTDDTGAGRYELRIDGALAAIEEYTLEDGVISFNHTEALEGFEGTGAARQLAERILDEVRTRGLQVLPVCPYLSSFIAKHPEAYLELVPADRRAEFGL
jgi:predicted GNAT family acetyltransferase